MYIPELIYFSSNSLQERRSYVPFDRFQKESIQNAYDFDRFRDKR